MHELDMEFFFFFTIFRRGRIVILSLFIDFHVISFSSFLDLSLIKHGFFLCSFFSSLCFLTNLFGYCFREQFLKTQKTSLWCFLKTVFVF